MQLFPLLKGIATFVPGLYDPKRGATGGSVTARYCYSVWLRHLRTVHASKEGDAAIVVEAQTAHELGHDVVVVTADRALAQRVEHVGCRTMSPSWLLSVIST